MNKRCNNPAPQVPPTGRSLSPPGRLSPSASATFKQCPRRWRFRYIDKLPEPLSPEAVAGSIVHRVLELLMQRDPPARTKTEARKVARRVWDDMAQDEPLVSLSLDDDEARALRWRVWKAVEGLWSLENPAEVTVEATEKEMPTTLGEVPFLGVIDRLDVHPDGLVISDYKSGKAPAQRYSQERLQQVLLYAAAVQAETGKTPTRARLMYLGQKIVSTRITSEVIQDAVSDFSDTWQAIIDACDTDSFEPRPGPLCGYCAFVESCPEGAAEAESRASLRAAEEASLLRLAG